MARDKIQTFDQLKSEISTQPFLKYYDLTCIERESNLLIIKISEDAQVIFSITVMPDLSVVSKKNQIEISPGYTLGATHRLDSWSKIEKLIEHILSVEIPVQKRIDLLSTEVQMIAEAESSDKLMFIANQLPLSLQNARGCHYNGALVKQGLKFYLSNRRLYNQMRAILSLPSAQTLESYFKNIGSVHTASSSRDTVVEAIKTVKHKFFVIIFDEVYVLPSIRYRGGHVIGKAVDDIQKPARTVFSIMIKPLLDGTSFMARLVPVHKFSTEICSDEVMKIVALLGQHDCEVVSLISDNHPINRKVFGDLSKFRDNLPSDQLLKSESYEPFIGAHPQFKDEQFHTLFDPVHLIKSIRNNWLTEQNQQIEITIPDTDKKVCAKWSDLVEIYEAEKDNTIRRTKLSIRALRPNNIERQKVSLALAVFNNATSAALRIDGKHDTADFIDLFLKMWNILNIKNPRLHVEINDCDRMPIYSGDDPRLYFLLNLSNCLVSPRGSKGKRRSHGFTYETAKALQHTLRSFVSICRYLLAKNEFRYILPSRFQSDDIEGEFGAYRQMSGGSYFISVEEIVYSAKFRNLRLFTDLESLKEIAHKISSCCSSDFTDDELSLLDSASDLSSHYADNNELSTLFYIAGFVSKKQGIQGESISLDLSDHSEFCQFLDRGKLTYPPEYIFNFVQSCYFIFEENRISCSNRFVRLCEFFFDCSVSEYPETLNISSLCRQLANCFYAGHVKKLTDGNQRVIELSLNERKKRKLEISSLG